MSNHVAKAKGRKKELNSTQQFLIKKTHNKELSMVSVAKKNTQDINCSPRPNQASKRNSDDNYDNLIQIIFFELFTECAKLNQLYNCTTN